MAKQQHQWQQINRDPFARETLMRRTTPYQTHCSWCGSTPSKHALYEYGTERDDRAGVNIFKEGTAFCGIGCMRSYTSS